MLQRFLAVLLFSLPLFGQITVLPVAPVAGDAVTLRFYTPCGTTVTATVRTGRVIAIAVAQGGPRCPSLPVDNLQEVTIPALPAGEYRVEVTGSVTRSTTFVVRDPAVLDKLRPFAVPSQGGLRVKLRDVPCGDGCERTQVNVGGTIVRGVVQERKANTLHIYFVAPPHAPGLVDVTVTTDLATVTYANALYYFDRTAPDFSVFERVLFPILDRTGGQGGSDWVSEAVISNPKSWWIENYNELLPIVCIDHPCGERLSPWSEQKFSGDGHPRGVALLVPRTESENLAFSLRVRDTSREGEGFGTQVPVVREKEMVRGGDLTLLDVPVDPRYRAKLRVYVFPDPHAERELSAVAVRLLEPPSVNAPQVGVALSRACTGAACGWTPYSGELDLPAEGNGERRNVYVTIPDNAIGWAFVSVTNNATQQVTVVTPDGRGGRPCESCT